MEIRARYTLIGLFTLAVIAAGFAFVYWLNVSAGIRQRSLYHVRYSGGVSGLLVGSAVLFNGLRVGEVTALQLDPSAPQDVFVDIAVERATPVRADTRIGIDFQGLAGAPVVALAGGTPSLPLLATLKGGPPVLIADKDAGRGMTQAARDVLTRIDAVVTDNAEPLRSLIANVDKFAGALSRNSDRIDGIVAGLERLTGGGTKAAMHTFDLAAAKSFPSGVKASATLLQIAEPTALSVLDTEKVVARQSDGTDAPALANARWPDLLPKAVQTRIVQSFEAAGFTGVLGRLPEGARSDAQLMIEIRSFQVTAGATNVAEVEWAAKLLGADARVLGMRTFRATAPVATLDAAASAAALSGAFETLAAELVAWTAGKL
jgi:phospholipid/cholesterol/gamma-HCH transport system substrate-binding protein